MLPILEPALASERPHVRGEAHRCRPKSPVPTILQAGWQAPTTRRSTSWSDIADIGRKVLLSGATFRTSGPALLNDIRTDATTRLGAVLAAPMKHEGRVVGVLELGRSDGVLFTDEDTDIAEHFAKLASAALGSVLRRHGSAKGTAIERAQLLRDRKLADLGRLLSGVLHEVRTPITYVGNNLRLQQRRLSQLEKTHPDLRHELESLWTHQKEMQRGIDRMHRLLRDIRPLARNRLDRREPTDLVEIVLDAVHLFRGTTTSRTQVELDLESTHSSWTATRSAGC